MGPVKHMHLAEQVDRHAAALSFRHLGSKPCEQRFNIFPGDVRAGRMSEDGLQGLVVTAFQLDMVPLDGTACELGPFMNPCSNAAAIAGWRTAACQALWLSSLWLNHPRPPRPVR